MSAHRCIITVGLEIGGRTPAADILDAAGFDWTHSYGGPHWEDDATRVALRGVSAILAGSEHFDATTLENTDALQVIARNGVGYDKVDLDYCTNRGIVVTYAPGVMADAVADLTFALLRAMVRHVATGGLPAKSIHVKHQCGSRARAAQQTAGNRTTGKTFRRAETNMAAEMVDVSSSIFRRPLEHRRNLANCP